MNVVKVTFRPLLMLACTLPCTVRAQGLSTPVIGTARSSAATADPTSVFYNPAMISFVPTAQLFLGGAVIIGDIPYQRAYRGIYQNEDSLDFALPISATTVDETKQGSQAQVRSNPVAAAPGGFLSVPLGDSGLTAGLGAYSPYAAVVAFPDGGPQRFQLREAFIATMNVTPTLSWRPHRSVSIGVGVSYVIGFAELSRLQDFAALPDLGAALENLDQTNDFGPTAPTGVRELDVMARPIVLRRMWAHSATFNVGLAVEPADGLMLGLSYQHETPMTFRGQFELDMDDDFFTQDLRSEGLAYPARVLGDADLDLPLPSVLRFAARYQFTRSIAFGADIAYTFWSIVESFDVVVRSPDLAQPDVGLPDFSEIRLDRDWRNTLGIDLFGDVRLSESTLLYGRVGFRQSAVPDTTIDVASPDGDRIVAVGGLLVWLGKETKLMTELGVQTTLEREVIGSNLDLGNGTYRLTLFHGGLTLAMGL